MRTFGDFELIGFHIDHYQDGRFMGSLKVEDADRELFGYQSRQYEIAEKDITLKKDKTIKKGTSYYTELIPLCGKVVGDVKIIRGNKKY